MADTRIGDIREELVDYATELECEALTSAQARLLLTEATSIVKVATDLQSRAAARLADTGPRSRGKKLAARELARRGGIGVKQAEQAIDTQRKLEALPATKEAARRGELSAPQTAAICAGAGADPGAERHLLGVAREKPLFELKHEAARVRAAAEADADERRRRQHADRQLRHWHDDDGTFHVHMRNTTEAGADLLAALAPFTDACLREARATGHLESLDAHRADALVAMARATCRPAAGDTARPGPSDSGADDSGADDSDSDDGDGASDSDSDSDSDDSHPRPRSPEPGTGSGPGGPAGGGRELRVGPPAKIIVRVDLGALLRGYPVPGEVCEICGVGPVAVSALTELLDTGDPFLAAVVTDGEKLTGAVHLGRRPRALQQTALEWLHPTCAAEDCQERTHLEFDHHVDWADSHVTVLEQLTMLCGYHHGLKTHKGWALVDGTGKRPFVAPDDPRHPRHAHDGNRSPPSGAAHRSTSGTSRTR